MTEGLQEQSDALANMSAHLERFMARLETVEQQQQTPATTNPVVATAAPDLQPVAVIAPAPTTSTPRSHLKPALPTPFDGDRANGHAFISSCSLYFQLCPNDFADEQIQIHWVMSFFKSGRAATYAERILRKEIRTNVMTYADWDAFYNYFVEYFCPENEATDSIMRLETDKYFQGRRSVDAYIDEFTDLVEQAEYTDTIAIVIKFRKGLLGAIQDKVAESGSDCPSNKDIEGWYKAARRCDRNRIANEAFRSAATRRTTPATQPFSFKPSVPLTKPTPFSFARPPPVAPPKSLSNGIPMDVDRTKHRAPRTDDPNCYRCGNPDHFARDCPLRFDVRHMTADEQQDLLEQMLATRDAVPYTPEESSSGPPVKVIEREVKDEDFVRHSG